YFTKLVCLLCAMENGDIRFIWFGKHLDPTSALAAVEFVHGWNFIDFEANDDGLSGGMPAQHSGRPGMCKVRQQIRDRSGQADSAADAELGFAAHVALERVGPAVAVGVDHRKGRPHRRGNTGSEESIAGV